ncbi:MAG: hypothetical protein M3N98_11295 [Actinomycetota bacterium]|nr:hypothetical protein [Actinomycetota bacterium]
MGFLDRAKKLAEQAKDKAEQATKKAEEALADARARNAGPAPPGPAGAGPGGAGPPPVGSPTGVAAGDVQFGTPYVPGMLGRPGWRERGLIDPAAVLPIAKRDRVGVPRSTKSQILEEPFGMGRRWSSGGRSAALFYQLYPDHQTWDPPGGKVPMAEVSGASTANLADGRSLVFVGASKASVVLEAVGLDGEAVAALTRTVADHLASA